MLWHYLDFFSATQHFMNIFILYLVTTIQMKKMLMDNILELKLAASAVTGREECCAWRQYIGGAALACSQACSVKSACALQQANKSLHTPSSLACVSSCFFKRKREKKEERRHVLSEASQYYSNTAHTVQTGCHGYTVTALEEDIYAKQGWRNLCANSRELLHK